MLVENAEEILNFTGSEDLDWLGKGCDRDSPGGDVKAQSERAGPGACVDVNRSWCQLEVGTEAKSRVVEIERPETGDGCEKPREKRMQGIEAAAGRDAGDPGHEPGFRLSERSTLDAILVGEALALGIDGPGGTINGVCKRRQLSEIVQLGPQIWSAVSLVPTHQLIEARTWFRIWGLAPAGLGGRLAFHGYWRVICCGPSCA